MEYWALVCLTVGVLVVVQYVQGWLKRRSRPPLPPGPRTWPIIGSALSIPRDKEWYTFTKWAKEYGPIVYFRVLGMDFVVLNSEKTINDLLVARGANYSDRPALEMLSDLTDYNKVSAFLPYGDRLTGIRKMVQSILMTRSVPRWHSSMEHASQLLIHQLMTTSDPLYKHVLLYAGDLVLRISHGYAPQRKGDPLLELAEQTVREIGYAFEFGTWWVEFFPWLKYVPEWLPGAGWKRKIKGYKRNLHDMVQRPHAMVKEQLRLGTAKPSFTLDFLDVPGPLSPRQDDMIAWAAHALYAGGTDTSVVAVESFFLSMTLFRDAYRKARAEVDAVVGRSRLPTAKDRDALPYVSALCKEILRWHPVAPVALPHAATNEDVYEGYYIPKGATVWGNSWIMLHDENIYPEPDEFKPERFLGPNPQPHPRDYGAFGHGRRRCPAVDFAETSLFVVAALSLSTLDIERKKDEFGNEIVPPGDFQHRIIPHPLPFPMDVRPRSEASLQLIKRALDDEEEVGVLPVQS